MNRYFNGKPGQQRARRAVDAIAIVFGLFLLALMAFASGERTATDIWLVSVLEPLPDWFDDVWRLGYLLGVLLIVGLFVGAILQRHVGLLRDMGIVVALTVILSVLLGWLVSDSLPTAFPELTGLEDVVPEFPILRVAVVTGVMMVAGPHLTRPVRLLGWAVVLLVAASGFGLGIGLSADAVGGIAVGLIAGGSVLLIFGSPRGYPDIETVQAALGELGIEIDDLELVPDQSWGVRTMEGTLDDGTPVEVKAYGRDAADTRMAAKAWRAIWYREADRSVSFSRLEAVEHEVLAMLWAADHGASVQTPLAVGVAGDDLALLARTDHGERLTDPSEEQLATLWGEVLRLHEGGLAHRGSIVNAATVDNGRIILGDFGDTSFNAGESQRALDIVSLLWESAVAVGAETAVAAATDAVPPDQLRDAIAYLQVPGLSPEQRKLVDKPKNLIQELRDSLAEATDSELPEPAKLRRIRPKDLIMPILSLVALTALVGMLADIDFASVWDVIKDATWILIIIGFFVGQITFLFEATGMRFATGYPLPLKPVIVLQLGVKWIGLAIPSAAGRVTMNTLFLRKYGVPPTLAVTQGAVDSLSGFIVESTILIIALIAADIPIDVDTDDVPWLLILLIAVLLIVGTVLAVWRIRKLHDLVVPIIKEAWGALSTVFTDPRRAFGLFGSNLASRTILALTLWFTLEAVGSPLPLVECLVIVVATNLLAGVVPIPGGIGVAEGVMTTFLVMAGVDSDTAFAVATVWRISTFYIPAGEGYFATKWLENGDYI